MTRHDNISAYRIFRNMAILFGHVMLLNHMHGAIWFWGILRDNWFSTLKLENILKEIDNIFVIITFCQNSSFAVMIRQWYTARGTPAVLRWYNFDKMISNNPSKPLHYKIIDFQNIIINHHNHPCRENNCEIKGFRRFLKAIYLSKRNWGELMRSPLGISFIFVEWAL